MPVPVWVFPAAKAVGKWVIATGGPPLIEVVKKYGPSVFRGYRKHGFKAKQIIDHVIAENAAERAKPVIAKSGKRRARQQQGQRNKVRKLSAKDGIAVEAKAAQELSGPLL